MKIDHVALWTSDLEQMKSFYESYFEGKASSRYHNPAKNFSSYFISFTDGCRLELMHKPEIPALQHAPGSEYRGLIHFAISVGSKEAVDNLTSRLAASGYTIAGQPRTTGDGYYESVVLDPEGNRIEITE
ncbi:VOC family protein [Cesiribacter sp. SM1]|uniref:VOC family protein n=1 Tax=Cesiribacter sp. SM1 TaxID=2861196 RepID=UPI001CD59EA7|nr:VOC family protein [Cesiribacter sp. SM1]